MGTSEEFLNRYKSYDHPVKANKQHFDTTFNSFHNKSSHVPKHSIDFYSGQQIPRGFYFHTCARRSLKQKIDGL